MRVPLSIAFALLAVSCSQAEPSPPAKPAELAKAPVFANVKLMDEPGFPTPDTYDHGQLLRRGPCLILRTQDGREYSPVLPVGSRFVRNGRGGVSIVILGTTLEEGQAATFKGASGQYGRSTPGPPLCPRFQFVVGHIISPEELRAITRHLELTPAPSRLPAS